MASFGFDASRHNAQAPGFSQTNDPFAGLSSGQNIDDALEFEDTYDGLGDNLEETGDAFNDDTFGGGSGGGGGASGGGGGGSGLGGFGSSNVGKDFDFFGQTAKVANAIDEEHARYNLLQPVAGATTTMPQQQQQYQQPQQAQQFQQPYPNQHQYQHQPQHFSGQQGYDFFGSSVARPARSGYEKYQEPEPDMQVDAALWGVAPKKPTTATPPTTGLAAKPPSGSRKILSLEEVEAAMRQKKPTTPSYPPQPVPDQALLQQQQPQQPQQPVRPPPLQQQQPIDYGYGPGIVPPPGPFVEGPQHQHPMTILQHANVQPTPPGPYQQQPQQQPQVAPPVQPTQILQNQNRLSGGEAVPPFGSAPFPGYPGAHHRQTSSIPGGGQMGAHPSQLTHLSEEDKVAYLEQEARRAKRNHKMFVLAKSNGLMTPQDKNFVTRIQLQQLVTATGNPNEHGTDEALKEDFYYQVLTQIRGTTRQHPSQPLNNFAQTYLMQTGGRPNGRRFNNRDHRAAENHMQRMDQQVQRAVEAAKNRPKNRQLIIEGTLGKISFSNAKTPKPLLNIKRAESGGGGAGGSNGGSATGGGSGGSGAADRPGSAHKASRSSSHHPAAAATVATVAGTGMDRKAVLASIEKVYATLMEIEDHDRKMPAPVTEASDEGQVQRQAQWAETMQQLTARLWRELKVHEPIGAFPVHPFIAILSVGKGMKAIPRVFRFLSHELRATLLTMIVVHLDQLDIVRQAQVNQALSAALRESIDLFILTVVNTLFNFMAELGLDLVTGVLGLVTNLRVAVVAQSRIGASMLTMILSRAELIKQGGGGAPAQWQAWEATYTTFFDTLEPTLAHMFPGTVASSEDMYVWQLLAALGIGANPDQQQRLVLAVKDRVMDTVAVAKTLPADLATQRLQSVNLFMRSIGLDVELLQ